MAATPLWETPEQWKARLGTDVDLIPPIEGLLAEIYNQLYNSSSSDMISLYGTTDGTADFVSGLLIGKSVKAVWVDGILLDVSAYTSDPVTGTITFVNVPDTGLQILIFYTA